VYASELDSERITMSLMRSPHINTIMYVRMILQTFLKFALRSVAWWLDHLSLKNGDGGLAIPLMRALASNALPNIQHVSLQKAEMDPVLVQVLIQMLHDNNSLQSLQVRVRLEKHFDGGRSMYDGFHCFRFFMLCNKILYFLAFGVKFVLTQFECAATAASGNAASHVN
jgi:hypothetical protein